MLATTHAMNFFLLSPSSFPPSLSEDFNINAYKLIKILQLLLISEAEDQSRRPEGRKVRVEVVTISYKNPATHVKNTWTKSAWVVLPDVPASPVDRLPVEVSQHHADDPPRVVSEAVLLHSSHRDDAVLHTKERGRWNESNAIQQFLILQ